MSMVQAKMTDNPVARPGYAFFSFFYLGADGKMVIAEDRECENDTHALELGRELLLKCGHQKIEIWFRGQRVGSLDRNVVD